MRRILLERGLIDFYKKHKVLNGILGDRIAALHQVNPHPALLPKLQACKKVLDLFPKEIIDVRNALAHQMMEFAETGEKKVRTMTKAAEDIIITPEQCIGIRNNLRKHMENLLDLEKLIAEADEISP